MDADLTTLGTRHDRASGPTSDAFATDHKVDDAGRRVYWALAYDATATDRHGTRMTADAFNGTGLDFPILAFHNRESYPVGKPVDLSFDSRGMSVGFVFADTDEAKTAESLVAGGFLRGVSVGFIPTDGYRDKNDDGTVVFTEAELLELSLTPTPSSRKALIDLSRSADLADPDLLVEQFALSIDDDLIDPPRCAFCGKPEPCFCAEESGGPEYSAEDAEERADSLTGPDFMRASCRRGLKLHEEGHSGAGLKPETVAAARKLADGGEWSVDKWRRCAAWIARHLDDLDAYDGSEPTPGLVAMLLWGGGSTKQTAERAAAHARAVAEKHRSDRRMLDDIIAFDDALEVMRNLGLDEKLLAVLGGPQNQPAEQQDSPQEAVRASQNAAGDDETVPENTGEVQPSTVNTERQRRHRRTARSARHSG